MYFLFFPYTNYISCGVRYGSLAFSLLRLTLSCSVGQQQQQDNTSLRPQMLTTRSAQRSPGQRHQCRHLQKLQEVYNFKYFGATQSMDGTRQQIYKIKYKLFKSFVSIVLHASLMTPSGRGTDRVRFMPEVYSVRLFWLN